MKSYEAIYWIGLCSWVAACIGLSWIGLRNTTFLGTHRPVTSRLKPVDIKISKVSAVLFFIGLCFFILGFWME